MTFQRTLPIVLVTFFSLIILVFLVQTYRDRAYANDLRTVTLPALERDLGVTVTELDAGGGWRRGRVRVQAVRSNGPFATAGIRPGDIIRGSLLEFCDTLEYHRGKDATLTLIQPDDTRKVTIHVPSR